MKLAFVVTLLFVAVLADGQQGSWLQWGNGQENTFVSPDTTITKTNVANLKQKWNFELPTDGVYSSVVVKNGIVYVPGVYQGTLYALSTSTGVPVQSFNGGQPIEIGVGPFGYNAGATPAIVGNQVIVSADTMHLFSFNLVTGQYNPSWPVNGSFVAVYQTGPGGQAQAEIQASMRVFSQNGENYLLIVTSSASEVDLPPEEKGTVNLYSTTNGALLWSAVIGDANSKANGMGAWSTPAVSNGVAYFGTSNPQGKPATDLSDALQAWNVSSGVRLWNTQLVAHDVSGVNYPNGIGNDAYHVDRDVGGSPNLLPNGLVGVSGKDGIYHAYNAATGAQVWQVVLTPTPTSLGNPSAAYNNGVIYVAASSDVSDNSVTPQCPSPRMTYLVQVSGYGGFGYSPPQDFDLNEIFVACITTQGIVTAINAYNGQVLWSKTFPTVIFGTPVYANGLLYVGYYDGTLRVFDATNGNVLLSKIVTPPQPPILSAYGCYNYSLPANYAIPANVVVVDGQVFVPYTNVNLPGGGLVALGL